ncbi:MAG: UbiA family prenyltransferase [bacterium]|nr:UbiA family prenyltransferase [bacterium]
MLRTLLNRVESINLTFSSWILGFLGILFVRTFLESFSDVPATGNMTSDASTIVHYYLYFLAVTVSLLLFLGLFIDRAKLEKISLFALAGNIVVPLLDLIISKGRGSLHYLTADGAGLLKSFFLFFTQTPISGVTAGIRISVYLGLVALFLYMMYSTNSIKKAALAVFGSYAIMFFWGSLPSVWKLFIDLFSPEGVAMSVSQFFITSEAASVISRNFLHPTVQLSYFRGAEVFFNVALSSLYYIFIFFLVASYFFVRHREKFSAILKNSRQFRASHYYIMIGIGLLLGSKISPVWISWNWLDVVSLVVLFLAYFCARAYAGGVNDIEDLEIDRISNPHRPLPSGLLTVGDIKNTNLFFLAWALLGGFLVGEYALFTIVAALFASYVYSAPPLRLKAYPLIATFLIALASLAAFTAGFYFTSLDKTTRALPGAYILLIVLALTLGENAKDIKDVEGDKRSGIYTLPVIFGERMGKKIVGILAALAFLSVPIILPSTTLFVVSLCAGITVYFLVNRKEYSERPIFLLSFIYAAIAVPLVFFML